MLELSSTDKLGTMATANVGIAGDTFNTAVYAARHGANVSYFTQLGDDPYSEKMLALLESEGIGTIGIRRLEGREPGLYMISNRADGERTFHYWRNNSPAREMLNNEDSITQFRQSIESSKIVYLSGITLGILGEAALQSLHEVLTHYRSQGGQVAFDSNFRPRLWRSLSYAKEVMQYFMAITDIALLTDEDEESLWGCKNNVEISQQHSSTAVTTLVIKCGKKDVSCYTRGSNGDSFSLPECIPVPLIENVIDTTAAGDSFNGAFLAAALNGSSIAEAIKSGIECAGRVIQYRGGIIPK